MTLNCTIISRPRLKRRLVLVFYIVLALSWSFQLQAQVSTGQISGTIRDSSGAVVPGAIIRVTNPATAVTRSFTSNSSGDFAFPALPVGTYSVVAERDGLQRTRQDNVVVDASSDRKLVFTMPVGTVSTDVVVTTDQQNQVETGNAQIATTITGQQVEDIALNGRNYEQLVRLLPGAVAAIPDPFNIQLSALSTYVNGVRGATTLNLADGLILEDIGANISVFAIPNPDSIAEVRVLAANFDASNPSPYGGPSVNVITKGGTRNFHGNAFEFVRNTMFNAKQDFATVVLPLHFNDYGFTLGGPLYVPGKFNADRSKLFFFASEEWKLIHGSVNATALIPTPDQINGIFTTPVHQPGSTLPYTSCPQRPSVMNTPATGYCIPNTAFSAIGAAQLQAYLAHQPNVTGQAYNYVSALVNNLDNREDRYNVDYLPTHKDVLTFHFAKELNNQVAGNAADVVPRTYTPRPAYLFSINETHTFSSNLLNTIVVGETHNLYAASPDTTNISLAARKVTLNNPFPNNTFGVLPNLTLAAGGFTSYSSVAGDTKTVENLLLTDDLSYIKGRHTMRFGVYLQKSKDDEHNFTTTQGSTVYTGAFTGSSLGDTLIGNFTQFTQGSTPGFFLPRYLVQEYYAMDNWKATQRLTLEYGMRYIYSQLPYSAINNISVFNPAAYSAAAAPIVSAATGALSGSFNPFNGIQIVGSGFTPNSSSFFKNVSAISNTSPLTYSPLLSDPLVTPLFSGAPKTYNNTPKTNFAPRVGIAYDVFGDGHTAIRASYGIFFMRENTFGYSTDSSNYPFNATISIAGGNIQNPGGSSGTLNPVSLYTFANPYKSAYLQTRSFGVQQQLPRSMIFELNYVGNEALHMPMALNINQVRAGTLQANPGVNIAALRPYKGFAAITQQVFADTSNYNSLQATIGRRVGNGLSYSVSYTFSKTMEGTSQQLAGTALPQDSYNYKADYSIADIDRRNVLTSNAVYKLPFFKSSKNLLLREGLGGFTLSGVVFFQSGMPLNVVLPADNAGIGNDGQQERPNRVPGVDLYTHQNCSGANKFTANAFGTVGCQFLNKAAFAVPTAGTFGNLGRNTVIGPRYTQTDLSLFKSFIFTEHTNLELRAESFNLFNHDSLQLRQLTAGGLPFGSSDVVYSPTSTTFGVVGSVASSRVFQFAAKLAF